MAVSIVTPKVTPEWGNGQTNPHERENKSTGSVQSVTVCTLVAEYETDAA